MAGVQKTDSAEQRAAEDLRNSLGELKAVFDRLGDRFPLEEDGRSPWQTPPRNRRIPVVANTSSEETPPQSPAPTPDRTASSPSGLLIGSVLLSPDNSSIVISNREHQDLYHHYKSLTSECQARQVETRELRTAMGSMSLAIDKMNERIAFLMADVIPKLNRAQMLVEAQKGMIAKLEETNQELEQAAAAVKDPVKVSTPKPHVEAESLQLSGGARRVRTVEPKLSAAAPSPVRTSPGKEDELVANVLKISQEVGKLDGAVKRLQRRRTTQPESQTTYNAEVHGKKSSTSVIFFFLIYVAVVAATGFVAYNQFTERSHYPIT